MIRERERERLKGIKDPLVAKNSVAMHYKLALQLFLGFIFSTAVQQRQVVRIIRLHFFEPSAVIMIASLLSCFICLEIFYHVEEKNYSYTSKYTVLFHVLNLFKKGSLLCVDCIYCGSALLWHGLCSEVILPNSNHF